ncbi:MAG: uroporphyrinogen decarboxylase family protein [Phycisphaerae bacterium]
MTKRQVVIDAINFRRPAYVPWAWSMTVDCARRVREYIGKDDLTDFIDSHFLPLGADVRLKGADADYVRDVYGVLWDRTVDKDIGTPCEWPIKEPSDLAKYNWPDANNPEWYAGFDKLLAANQDRFRWFNVGFSLFERAWTMRGMENLLIDMIERPEFVDEFLDAIVEHDLVQVRKALAMDFDGVYFGDDYGSQRGLIMGITHWRRFIKPRLARMFGEVRKAGKYVSMHSCGCVAELFDELVEIGLQLFNPFQPEVMDVFAIKKKYHGRLAFHGGMSIQKVLPFATVAEVRAAARKLIEAGRCGGYVFSPSHAVPRDVPPENLVAMMEELKAQKGYRS